MDDRTVLLDTNVLLDATTPARGLHEAARAVLDDWPNQGVRLCVSGQVLREYLVVATREVPHNGLGLSVPDALGNTAAFAGRCKLLAEGPDVVERLREVLGTVACSGKQIHDANLVATALAHGVPELLTANVEDFERFRGHLGVIPLMADRPKVGPPHRTCEAPSTGAMEGGTPDDTEDQG